jgi:hypothetical protein
LGARNKKNPDFVDSCHCIAAAVGGENEQLLDDELLMLLLMLILLVLLHVLAAHGSSGWREDRVSTKIQNCKSESPKRLHGQFFLFGLALFHFSREYILFLRLRFKYHPLFLLYFRMNFIRNTRTYSMTHDSGILKTKVTFDHGHGHCHYCDVINI